MINKLDISTLTREIAARCTRPLEPNEAAKAATRILGGATRTDRIKIITWLNTEGLLYDYPRDIANELRPTPPPAGPDTTTPSTQSTTIAKLGRNRAPNYSADPRDHDDDPQAQLQAILENRSTFDGPDFTGRRPRWVETNPRVYVAHPEDRTEPDRNLNAAGTALARAILQERNDRR